MAGPPEVQGSFSFVFHGGGLLFYCAYFFLPLLVIGLPAVPFLSVFAAYTISNLTAWGKERRIKEIIIIGGLTVVLYAVTIFSFRSEVLALDRWQMATRVHYVLGGNQYFKKRRN